MVLEEKHQHPTDSPTQPKWDASNSMLALVFHGKRSVSLDHHPRPLLVDSRDALVRITKTAICGSDLHLYHNAIAETEQGDILGHEAVGIIEKVGSDVRSVHVGQRVVISAVIACGSCKYCKMGRFSNCNETNPSGLMEKTYGHRTAGLFGYSHLTGGYPGLQAQYARVPYADVNLLPISDGVEDSQAIMLSDVACTAYQAVLYSEAGQDEYHRSLVIWGAGPIGMTSACLAKTLFRADKVVVVDNVPDRLITAKQMGFEVIDFNKDDVLERLRDMFQHGPDSVIDAVGFRYAKSIKHKLETTVMVETDAIDALVEAITAVRKSGVVSIIGDYVGFANHFPIGAMYPIIMEKGLTIRSGQLHCQSYWKMLHDKIKARELDFSWLTSDRPFEDIAKVYEEFDEKSVLKPIFTVPH